MPNPLLVLFYANMYGALTGNPSLGGGPSPRGEGSASFRTWSEFENSKLFSLFNIDGTEVACNVVQDVRVGSIVRGRPKHVIDKVVCVKNILDGGAHV